MPVPDRVVESGMSEEIDEAFISIVFLVVQAQTFFSGGAWFGMLSLRGWWCAY